ncbi:hypothetical protein [Halomarina litorea]|uniref:hypothetical protein n=1 Tax=Halomarina litorea TaxID=2961595 RepID=UPI0020C3D2D1|nr:hypothetical protein [Halomarina sp. BCD28]
MSTNDSDAPDRIDQTRRSDAIRRVGEEYVMPKSVVEGQLHPSEHRLVPDQSRAPASDALLDALIDAFSTVAPTTPTDQIRAAEEVADLLRELRDSDRPLIVVRESR